MAISIGGSALVHLLLVPPIIASIVRERDLTEAELAAAAVLEEMQRDSASQGAEGKDQEPLEFEIELPAFVEMVARPELKNALVNYLRTTQNDAEDEAPEDPAFQSDRNTHAASELPADPNGDRPLPTQRGVDLPVVELAAREYVDGEIADDRNLGNNAPELADAQMTPPVEAAQPAEPSPFLPSEPVPGSETPESGDDREFVEASTPPKPEEEFAIDPNSDELIARARKPLEVFRPDPTETENPLADPLKPRQGMADAETEREEYDPLAEHRPPSPVRPQLRPGSDEAAPDIFQPQTRPNEQRGTISNRGSAAADAVNTPMGRYMRKVTSAIEKEWNRKRVAKSDFVTYGNIRLKFFVERDGKVKSLRIENPGKANPIMQDFSLSAVLEAPIPPIPPALLSDLTDNRIPVTYDIIIY